VWAYEITPDGVKLESEIDREQSITPVTGRKLDFLIIGILTVAVVFFALDKFAWTEKVIFAEAPPPTIAVLPFVNISSNVEQEYFSDGLSEELLNLLAKIPELKVTSRSSSFFLQGKRHQHRRGRPRAGCRPHSGRQRPPLRQSDPYN
jgi:hypothetical protein